MYLLHLLLQSAGEYNEGREKEQDKALGSAETERPAGP